MLFISGEDIKRAVSFTELIEEIVEAYSWINERTVLIPDRQHVDFKNNTFLLMPVVSEEWWVLKFVSIFPGNRDSDIPTLNGMLVLGDGKNGKPIAIIDAAILTAYRTGAVGGMAAKYLGRVPCKTLGIVGTGVQGIHQALFIVSSCYIEHVMIFDTSPKQVDHFCAHLKEYFPKIKITLVSDIFKLLDKCQIVVTATTSLKPVLPDNQDLLRDHLFIVIGSYKPFMREYPDSLFKIVDSVIVDVPSTINEAGDVSIQLKKGLFPKNKILLMREVLTTKKYLKIKKLNTVFFKSAGSALFDLAAAKYVYNKCVIKNYGQSFTP